ncbi:MAG: pyruvate dehydrogenase complex dihydrolipoamide acetyltransferase [Rhodospirillaceae bacterium]|nr:MAG: pyruvate dehydrogenase complex dihydrolipoamide acetyltransferase [Rhodospirillaceae bacterium]
MSTEILMPALSPTMTEGKLSKWLKKEGDAVKSGDVIAEIETDKATMEMEAVDEGVLGKILVPAGTEKVQVNRPIAVLLAEGEKASAAAGAPKPTVAMPAPAPTPAPKPAVPAPTASPAPSPSQPQPVPAQAAQAAGDRVFASPLAKRIAADAHVDVSKVAGSGPNGRVVKADVEKAAASQVAQPAAKPAIPPAPAGMAPKAAPASPGVTQFGQPYHPVKNTMMRRTIAKRLLESKTTVPHFYLTIDCLIDDLMRLRAELNGREGAGYKLSVNDFIIRASALAMRKVPTVNASWTDDSVLFYDDVDISVAVATPDGLITPIIRKADTKGLAAISNEMKELATKAKDKKLKPEEFMGGGFSISNLGMFGIKEFAAVINPPQATILAVGKGEQRPVVKKGALAIATMMTCTLSCDHRVVDGSVGAEFLQVFQGLIEDPLKMLL